MISLTVGWAVLPFGYHVHRSRGGGWYIALLSNVSAGNGSSLQSATAVMAGIRPSGVARLWSQGGASPSGVQGRNPVGSGAKPPEARYIYGQFAAVKCFSMQVCCRVCPPSPPTPPPKKLFGAARILWPNTAGAGWVRARPCPPVPTLLVCWWRHPDCLCSGTPSATHNCDNCCDGDSVLLFVVMVVCRVNIDWRRRYYYYYYYYYSIYRQSHIYAATGLSSLPRTLRGSKRVN